MLNHVGQALAIDWLGQVLELIPQNREVVAGDVFVGTGLYGSGNVLEIVQIRMGQEVLVGGHDGA